MVKTRLFIARHGKTMFNTIGRAQGWSDTPLTQEGEQGIHELGRGLRLAGESFVAAYSSDSGRTMQTMEIVLEELGQESIPYKRDKRIREWCFGSLDGGYDAELFHGVMPRVSDKPMEDMTYEEMAEAIVDVDTAGWAQPWPVLKNRILEGFTSIANEVSSNGGGDVIVVSHGMTIATFIYLLDPSSPRIALDNGSVSVLSYENGHFTIDAIGDMSYRQQGRLDRERTGSC